MRISYIAYQSFNVLSVTDNADLVTIGSLPRIDELVKFEPDVSSDKRWKVVDICRKVAVGARVSEIEVLCSIA